MQSLFLSKISSLFVRKLIGRKLRNYFSKNTDSLNNLVSNKGHITQMTTVFWGIFNRLENKRKKSQKKRDLERLRRTNVGVGGFSNQGHIETQNKNSLGQIRTTKRIPVNLALGMNDTPDFKNKFQLFNSLGKE